MRRRYPRHATRVILHNLFRELYVAINGVYPNEDALMLIEFVLIASAIILAHDAGERITTNGLAHRVGIARSTLRDKLDLWIAKGYVARDERGNLDIPETLLARAEVNAIIDRIRDAVIGCAELLVRQRDLGEC